MARLASHLNAARRSLFVGRQQERRLFEDATHQRLNCHSTSSISMVPGGVGKTTLLREFAQVRRRVPSRCSNSTPALSSRPPRVSTPPYAGFWRCRPNASPEDALAAMNSRAVLIVDTYELLTPLDRWLRERFLPNMPENVLVVLAGRNPPSADWQYDPGWQRLIRTWSLRNLSPEESLSLLEKREVPASQHEAVLAFTHGHPLALSLVADVFAQRRDFVFQPGKHPISSRHWSSNWCRRCQDRRIGRLWRPARWYG